MATTLSRAICLSILIGSVVRAAGGLGQDPAPEPARPTFSTESDLVVLHVTVFDRHGDPVPQLNQGVFHIVEDDTPQTISMFSGEDAPPHRRVSLEDNDVSIERRSITAPRDDDRGAEDNGPLSDRAD